MTRFRIGTGLLRSGLVAAVLLTALTVPAIAAVTIQGETTYQGIDGSSQAISVTTTLSPEDARITDVQFDIDATSQTFLDTESFETTINPGSADVNVTYDGDGVFLIDELNPDESVQVTYDVYPRTIKEESIDAASVSVSYVQNGQELSAERTFTANMQSSSWFAYQDLRGATTTSILDWVGRIAIVILALLLVYKAYDTIIRDSEPGPPTP